MVETLKKEGFLLINVLAPVQAPHRLNFLLINVLAFYKRLILLSMSSWG
jgi:hypothetical protein